MIKISVARREWGDVLSGARELVVVEGKWGMV
jgi:hypothetical protein